jgi:hypothetical protein
MPRNPYEEVDTAMAAVGHSGFQIICRDYFDSVGPYIPECALQNIDDLSSWYLTIESLWLRKCEEILPKGWAEKDTVTGTSIYAGQRMLAAQVEPPPGDVCDEYLANWCLLMQRMIEDLGTVESNMPATPIREALVTVERWFKRLSRRWVAAFRLSKPTLGMRRTQTMSPKGGGSPARPNTLLR